MGLGVGSCSLLSKPQAADATARGRARKMKGLHQSMQPLFVVLAKGWLTRGASFTYNSLAQSDESDHRFAISLLLTGIYII